MLIMRNYSTTNKLKLRNDIRNPTIHNNFVGILTAHEFTFKALINLKPAWDLHELDLSHCNLGLACYKYFEN